MRTRRRRCENALVTAEPEAEQICASRATYARLKEVAFEDAIRLRGADPASLDTLAASSVVRMETPLVLNRDEQLNVTVCSGRFILELPPGAEAAFGGERRLSAEIEYSAQAAADGSGLVYEIRGAEPIVQRLAAFNTGGLPVRSAGASPTSDQYARAAPAPVPPQPAAFPQPTAPQTAPRPVVRPAAPEPQRTRSAGGRPQLQLPPGSLAKRADGLLQRGARRARPRYVVAVLFRDGRGQWPHPRGAAPEPRAFPRLPRALSKRGVRRRRLSGPDARNPRHRGGDGLAAARSWPIPVEK